ncbi:MAG: protoporphyrinogen oxidase [Flavobacteriales bacterium]
MSASPENTPKRVAVIGAGISGLTAAFYLQKSGAEVKVFEKSERVGGCLKSIRKDGYLFEQGALTAVVNYPELKELFTDCGIENEVLYASEKSKYRFVFRNGLLHEVSPNPVKFLFSGLLSFSAKRRIFLELFKKPYAPESKATLGAVAERHFGKEVVDYILNPIITGIYASDPYDLELSSSFPVIEKAIRNRGSIIKGMVAQAKENKSQNVDRRIFNFNGGQSQLIAALSEKLSIEIQVDVRGLCKTDSGWKININGVFHEFDEVVLAAPAYASARLVEPFLSSLAQHLLAIKYNAVTTVQVVAPKNKFSRLPEGFGFLVPQKERGELLGCIFNHVLFPSRFNEAITGFNLFIGGELPSGGMVKIDKALDEFKSITGYQGELQVISHCHWANGIPLIGVGHSEVLQAIDAAESANEGLHFIGNYRNGISVGDCIKNARHIASEITKRRKVL